MKSVIALYSTVPRSVQNTAPGENGCIMNRSSCLPSTRWSRFFASSMRVEVRVQLLLLEEGGAVNALQHLALGVAAPIRARGVRQLEVFDARRVGHVRAATEVDERPVGVRGDDLVVAQLGEALELEGVVDEAALRLGAIHLFADERILLGRDLPHLVLEPGEILGGERLGDLEVVVEAFVDGRTEADLRVGAKASHGRGQHVRRGMPEHAQRCRVAVGEHAERAAGAQRRGEVLNLPVDFHGDGRLEQPLTDRADDVGGKRAARHVACRAVGEGECERVPILSWGWVCLIDHEFRVGKSVSVTRAGVPERRDSLAPRALFLHAQPLRPSRFPTA